MPKMKRVVGMATFGDRAKYAQRAIESLQNQVDEIFLYDNNSMPDLTDNGKFWGLTQISEPILYLSCDDDIIYPPTYGDDMEAEVERHGCIVTHHGRKLTGMGHKYYGRAHQVYHFKLDHPDPAPIDVAGTGVTAFRNDYFNPASLVNSKYRCMSDLTFSYLAAVEMKKIMFAGHRAGYLTPMAIPQAQTIYYRSRNSCDIQSMIADQIFQIKNIGAE